MGRNPVTGLSALAGIVVLLGVALWVGFPLVNLAFLDERRNEPVVVVELLKVSDSEDHQAHYLAPMAELLAGEGAHVQATYPLNHLMAGRIADEWQHANLISVPRASDFLQVMTSAPFRLLQDQGGVTASTRFGVFHATGVKWRPALVLWLVKSRQLDALDPFFETLPLWEAAQGRVVVNESVLVLDDNSAFNRMLVVDFPSTRAALTLLRSPEMRVLRSVVNGSVDHMSLAIYGE